MDKSTGITSREVVVQVRRHIRQSGSKAQIGHCGTLDPLATGLLVLAVGSATSLTPWFQGGDKSYVGTFQMGVTSLSLDLETPQIPVDLPPCPPAATLQSACRSLLGTTTQVPPKFSAVHVKGKRAYQLARSGRAFEVPPRTVRIDQLVLQQVTWPTVQLEVKCSGGTYVRTLGDDLAKKFGTRAVMTGLQRMASSRFRLEQACSLSTLLQNPNWRDSLIPIADALGFMPHVTVELETARRFRNGLVTHQLGRQMETLWQGLPPESTEVLVLLEDRRPVGIAYRRPRPDREWPWRIKLNLAQWLEPESF